MKPQPAPSDCLIILINWALACVHPAREVWWLWGWGKDGARGNFCIFDLGPHPNAPSFCLHPGVAESRGVTEWEGDVRAVSGGRLGQARSAA